jgi:hypothetical protein
MVQNGLFHSTRFLSGRDRGGGERSQCRGITIKYVSMFCLFSVPPGRPLIHNERGILVENVLGPYNEGAELMLTCSVSGGK